MSEPRQCVAFASPASAWSINNCISGLVVEYIVAIDVTRVRFPADALQVSSFDSIDTSITIEESQTEINNKHKNNSMGNNALKENNNTVQEQMWTRNLNTLPRKLELLTLRLTASRSNQLS